MVARGGLLYLVTASDNLSEIRLRAMHRIKDADLLWEESSRPEDFDLNEFIEKGGFGFGQGNTLLLKAAFTKFVAQHLLDTPLSEDQTITPYDAERVLVTANLADTQQLIWWLLSFGDKVEVLEPLELRQRMTMIAAGMSHRYNP